MSRPVERIEPMIALLRQVWLENPDQRLGQVIGNAARDRTRPAHEYRDPFNVEDDEMWANLKRWAKGDPPGLRSPFE